MGRGDASGACTPVGRRYHRLLSDVDEAESMKLRLALRWPATVAHKRALFCGVRPSKGGARPRDGFRVCLRFAPAPWMTGLPADGRGPVKGLGGSWLRSHVSSSSSFFASFKSTVSNPSVNQPYTGTSTSRASVRRPCSPHSQARLIAARNSYALACCVRATRNASWKAPSASSSRLRPDSAMPARR